MAGKNFAFTAKTVEVTAPEAGSTITLDNVHALTIFQLRQELTRRGIFDDIFGHEGEKRRINYNNCLEVMVGELLKEKDEREKKHALELEEKMRLGKPLDGATTPLEDETLQQRLAREKNERKQAAIERSKKRQADRQYFAARKATNEKHAAENEEGSTNSSIQA